MLTITGHFNGFNLDNGIVSAVDLAKAFNIPPPPKGSEVLEHRILQKKIKTNRADGQKVAPKSYSIPAAFTASHDGYTITVRYSTQPGRRTKEGTSWTPHMVTFAGTIMAFREKDYDKFVYMFLHPFNASSPFVGKDPQIEYYDPKAAAIEAQRKAQIMAEMNMAIWSPEKTSDEKIRLKAAGMAISTPGGEMRISVAKNIPTASLRQKLSDMFNKYPDAFIQAWNSDITVLYGLLSDAIEQGVIEHTPNTGSGRPGWVWRKGPSAGNIAVYTSPNDDARRTLQGFVSQPSNYDAVMEYLTRMLGDEGTKGVSFGEDQPLSAGIRSAAPAPSQWEMNVNQAISAGIIGFDMATKQVRFIDDEGNYTDQKPLMQNTTAKDWVKDTVLFLQSQQSVWHKGELKKRLAALVVEPEIA